MQNNKWMRLLAYVTGLVNQRLLLQCEYLAAENRILRAHLPARLRLSVPERSTLAEIGKRIGRKYLAEVACVAKPDPIPRLVPAADCPEVRRIQAPLVSRSAAHRRRSRGTDRSYGSGELRLGL